MIKFRQKEFVLPLATSLLTNGVFSAGIGAAGQMGAAKTAAKQQEESDRTQERIAAQQNRQAEKDRKAQAELQNNQIKAANSQFQKAASLQKKGISVTPTITSSNSQPQQQQYSNATEAKGFIKNIGTLAKERGLHKAMAGAVVGGAVSGGASYLIDRAIQKDVRKSGNFRLGVDNLSEKDKAALKKKRKRKLLATIGTGAALAGGAIAAKKGVLGTSTQNTANKYISRNTAKSIGNTFKESTKDYFTHVDPDTGKRKANTLNLALTGVSLAAPAVMYRMKKKQYQNQVRQSEGAEGERNYSKGSVGINFQNIGKQINGAFKRSVKPSNNGIVTKSSTPINSGITFEGIGKRLKEITKPSSNKVKVTNKPKSYDPGPLEKTSRTINFRRQLTKKASPRKGSWEEFKKHPGESILGKASQLSGGGGRSGVSKFGDDLEALGRQTGNVTSQKVGTFIKENPKTALAGSIVVGGVIVKKSRDKAGNLASKAIETVDPNAYAYSKYGAQPIVRGRRANNNNIEEEEEENG